MRGPTEGCPAGGETWGRTCREGLGDNVPTFRGAIPPTAREQAAHRCALAGRPRERGAGWTLGSPGSGWRAGHSVSMLTRDRAPLCWLGGPPAPAGRGPEWSELTVTGLEGMELHGVGVGCASGEPCCTRIRFIHSLTHSFSTCVSSPCQKYHPS